MFWNVCTRVTSCQIHARGCQFVHDYQFLLQQLEWDEYSAYSSLFCRLNALHKADITTTTPTTTQSKTSMFEAKRTTLRRHSQAGRWTDTFSNLNKKAHSKAMIYGYAVATQHWETNCTKYSCVRHVLCCDSKVRFRLTDDGAITHTMPATWEAFVETIPTENIEYYKQKKKYRIQVHFMEDKNVFIHIRKHSTVNQPLICYKISIQQKWKNTRDEISSLNLTLHSKINLYYSN